MTDAAAIEARWDEAHETAHRVRAALLAVGVPEAELDLLTARASITGAARVILPPLSLESAERLLAALGPALGPHGPHLGRGTLPLAAGHPV